ncbi:MAG: acyl carrier protein [Anaerolineales bacterium]
MSSVQTALLDFIQSELAIGRSQPIKPEDDLFTSGILDSLGVLQLVLFIEEQFGVKVPDQDVVFENFQSVAAIERYLADKKAETSTDGGNL